MRAWTSLSHMAAKRKTKTVSHRARRAAKPQPKGYSSRRHGDTEKVKIKGRPERTEVAEATERSAGAMGASAQESEGAPIDNQPVQTLLFIRFRLCAEK